jgi:hypothetical protein
LSLFHQFHYPIQRAIARGARCRDRQRAFSVDRAGENLVAFHLVDRHGLSCNWRLVDSRFAGLNAAVHRNALGGPHQDQIPGLYLLHGHVYKAGLALDSRDRRRELGQCSDRCAGATECVVLKRMGQRKKEQQESAFRPFTQNRRAERR